MDFMGRGMRCFLLTAETLNFSETARRLGITQQAVSKAVSLFEKELGITLFTRSKRTICLTEAGVHCRSLFIDTLDHLHTQLDLIRAQNACRADQVSIGYQNYLDLTDLLSDSMEYLHQTSPGLSVTCERYSPAMLLDALDSERLDLVLICRRFLPEHSRLHVQFLLRVPLLLLASEHFLQPGEPLEALRTAPLIIDRLESESPAALDARIRRETERCGLSPSRVIVAPNRDSAYTAAEMGQGAILCTGVSRFLGKAGLKAFDTGATDDLVCCWKRDCPNPHAAAYAQYLQQHCVKPMLGNTGDTTQ